MFVDIVRITVRAGKGGNGAVAFHREKYVAAGGPDGGDGGKGGNIVFVIDRNMSSLMDFRYARKFVAPDGGDGGTNKCFGKDGKDVVIKVPRGTLIKDALTGELMKDLSDDEPFVVARGGNGGWGNQHFATPTRQCPRFAKPGLPGIECELTLELKLLADVGIIGFPNVGKSTLLSVISSARPKIANYHFTTITPNLGVVYIDDSTSFVAADIPGLIEGAMDGAGLGHYFLRHVERCRLLVHVVDISCIEGRDPIEDFETINRELAGYSEILSRRPQIVVANKLDIMQDAEAYERFKEYVKGKGYAYFEMSAATGQGTKPLVNEIAAQLSKLPPITIFEANYVPQNISTSNMSREVLITVVDGAYIVESAWLQRVINGINFEDYESRMYFEKVLKGAGVFERLEEMGINEGDTVSIYNCVFDYIK